MFNVLWSEPPRQHVTETLNRMGLLYVQSVYCIVNLYFHNITSGRTNFRKIEIFCGILSQGVHIDGGRLYLKISN